MSDLLLDINLQQLPDEYLTGEWQVANRVLNQDNPGGCLAQAARLVLTPGQLISHASGQEAGTPGTWSIQRDELLQRPYLRFEFAGEKTRALITRLRRSADGQQSQLNLYFASGMEMQLNRA